MTGHDVRMTPWHELTERGRFRRLRAVAEAALDRYDVVPDRISLVGGFTNAVFRIDAGGVSYALRVDLFQDHTDGDSEIELAWVEALARDTDVDVASPVRTIGGELFCHASAPGVPNSRRCTLFEWVPGSPVGNRPTPSRLRRLGEIAATMHRHGAAWDAPARPMAWDRVFYWPEQVDPFVLDAPEHAHHFGDGRRDVLERAIGLVGAAFTEVAADSQIVHGDLHLQNVHAVRNRLWVIDFEDVLWAHPVQDLAITVNDIERTDAPDELRAAFRAGYETVQPWPEARPGLVDTFVAGRILMFTNFVLNALDDPAAFYDRVFPRLERFVDTWG